MQAKFLFRIAAALAFASGGGIATALAGAPDGGLNPLPPALEIRFALSAAPPALRGAATVYVLDVTKGYRVARQGSSGVECLVERTAWEHAEYRDDVFVPLCYDAAGARTYLKVIREVAELRANGKSAAAVKAEIERRYQSREYQTPGPGVSYMIAPIMRTWMLPDMNVHTMPMPHVMFYAPNISDRDLGARPGVDIAFPFIFKEGIAEQSYVIQVLGESEKANILTTESELLHDLCDARSDLCISAPN
ncbi:MAG: hypothetical protein R3E77_14120 [Steroidobacteraceae bacterium]